MKPPENEKERRCSVCREVKLPSEFSYFRLKNGSITATRCNKCKRVLTRALKYKNPCLGCKNFVKPYYRGYCRKCTKVIRCKMCYKILDIKMFKNRTFNECEKCRYEQYELLDQKRRGIA